MPSPAKPVDTKLAHKLVELRDAARSGLSDSTKLSTNDRPYGWINKVIGGLQPYTEDGARRNLQHITACLGMSQASHDKLLENLKALAVEHNAWRSLHGPKLTPDDFTETIGKAFGIWLDHIEQDLSGVPEFLEVEFRSHNPDFFRVLRSLGRVARILRLMNSHFAALETLSPLDSPKLGNRSTWIKDKTGVTERLAEIRSLLIKNSIGVDQTSLKTAVNLFLERGPFWKMKYWGQQKVPSDETKHPFIITYRQNLERRGGRNEDKFLIELFDRSILGELSEELYPSPLSRKATQTALFIMVYADENHLRVPFGILLNLLKIDEQFKKLVVDWGVTLERNCGIRRPKAPAPIFGELLDVAELVFQPAADLPKKVANLLRFPPKTE